jgi:hypothetical protein
MIYVYMYIYNNLVTNTETIFVKKNWWLNNTSTYWGILDR